MITLTATLIDAEARKAKIECVRCNLSYSARDYNILYEEQKLAYFKFKPAILKRAKVFCHDCLHKECIQMLKGGYKKIKLTMRLLDDQDIICTFEK